MPVKPRPVEQGGAIPHLAEDFCGVCIPPWEPRSHSRSRHAPAHTFTCALSAICLVPAAPRLARLQNKEEEKPQADPSLPTKPPFVLSIPKQKEDKEGNFAHTKTEEKKRRWGERVGGEERPCPDVPGSPHGAREASVLFLAGPLRGLGRGSAAGASPPARDRSGGSAAGGGAATERAAENWQQLRAEPFFFSSVPSFPPSLPPSSLSFPLSLLSLPFSLSLSCIHGWHGEPLCIYVHNTAARPLHFICIITISVQAHHIVCCLHLLLRLLSQSTRLDFHILNELILYQQHALTSPARGNRAPARRAPQPQPLPSLSFLPLIPGKVGCGGKTLRRINYSYKLLLVVLIFFPSLVKEML
ncbi:uncharacterized protein GJ701_010008 [Geothlypis trichas]